MYPKGCIESLNPELALYGSKNGCTRTNTVLPTISEVSTGAVSLLPNFLTTIPGYRVQVAKKNILIYVFSDIFTCLFYVVTYYDSYTKKSKTFFPVSMLKFPDLIKPHRGQESV